MKIYLVRHGESVAKGSDDERPLSQQGEKDIQNLANFLLPLKLQVSSILHSPKFRAKQTAEILSSSIHATKNIEIRPELDPMSSVNDIIEEIYAREEDLMLVGHMPYMGKMAAKLISGNEYENIVAFKPGSMVCLEQIESERWAINWMLAAELFH